MKRTEKIEIRLSHEEKTALTGLAEKEGRTVSKLVRDVVSKYMDLNTANLPHRWNRWKITALTTAATIFGFGLSNALSMSNHSEVFDLDGFINDVRFETTLNRRSKKPISINVKSKTASYRLEAIFVKKNDFYHLMIDTCKVTSEGCESISKDEMVAHTDKRSSFSKHMDDGYWSFHLKGPYYKNPKKR